MCLLTALILFCAGFSSVLLPERLDYGATWGMYEKEKKHSVDFMFFGSSLAYCDIIPSVIYEDTGLTSYVMAGPEQTIPLTYWYLRQACSTQSPKVVFIEATGMFFSSHSKSVKINLTYMPWSINRLAPTFTEASEDERAGLLFPLYAYHDRWDRMTWDDFSRGILGYDPDPLAGYTFLDAAKPIETIKDRPFELQEDLYSRNLKYAEKIAAFCKERDILPISYLTPNTSRPSAELTAKLRTDFEGLGVEFRNYNDAFDSLNLDLSTDFFDTLHFNYRGACKFSAYLASELKEFGLTPSADADAALWQERIRHFSALKDKADSGPVKLSGAADTPS